jgi:hypothetical protein
MGDRPTKLELLEAVRRFLADELMPELEGVRRFHARVAANALAIIAREIELEPAQLRARRERLAGLLDEETAPPDDLTALAADVERLESELCGRIRAGEADAPQARTQLVAHLLQTAREKLAVSNPAYG